jgi:hypothetical protein
MRKFLVSMATLCVAIATTSHADPEWTAFALAPNDTTTAIFRADPATLVLRGDSTERQLPVPELAWQGDANVPRLLWSPDSRYLVVEAAVEEDATLLEVFDVEKLTVVWKGPSAGASWLRGGHRLLVVPAYEISGPQEAPGLLLVDPAAGTQRVVARGYRFTGNIDAGNSIVVGDVARDTGGLQHISLDRVDLASELSEPESTPGAGRDGTGRSRAKSSR